MLPRNQFPLYLITNRVKYAFSHGLRMKSWCEWSENLSLYISIATDSEKGHLDFTAFIFLLLLYSWLLVYRISRVQTFLSVIDGFTFLPIKKIKKPSDGVDWDCGGESGRWARAGRDISVCISWLEPCVPIQLHFPKPPHLTNLFKGFKNRPRYRRISITSGFVIAGFNSKIMPLVLSFENFRFLVIGTLVEWWRNDGMKEWRNEGMTEWRNDGMK